MVSQRRRLDKRSQQAGRIASKRTSGQGGRVMWQQLGESVRAWRQDNAFRMAAALAYYSVFSLIPLLLLGLGLLGALLGERVARGEFQGQLQELFGEEPGRAVEGVLRDVHETGTSTLCTAVGLGVLVVGACWVLFELRDALGTIWRSPTRSGPGMLGRLAAGLGSLAAVLGTGLLLLAMITADFALTQGMVDLRIALAYPGLSYALNVLLSVVLVVGLFAVLYRILPRARVRWRDVWGGALLAGLLYEVGKHAISLYVGYFVRTSVIGAATSLVAVLIWVYYSALIFLFGAEFIRVSPGSRDTAHCPATAKPHSSFRRPDPDVETPPRLFQGGDQ
jgi:membrane protein